MLKTLISRSLFSIFKVKIYIFDEKFLTKCLLIENVPLNVRCYCFAKPEPRCRLMVFTHAQWTSFPKQVENLYLKEIQVINGLHRLNFTSAKLSFHEIVPLLLWTMKKLSLRSSLRTFSAAIFLEIFSNFQGESGPQFPFWREFVSF